MAGRSNARTDMRSEVLANAQQRTNSSIVQQLASDFAEGDESTVKRITSMIARSGSPEADQVVIRAIEQLYDAADPSSQQQMLESAAQASPTHPLISHAQGIGPPAEGGMPVERQQRETDTDRARRVGTDPINDIRYQITNWAPKSFRDRIVKRYGQPKGNTVRDIAGDEVEAARNILRGQGMPAEQIDAMDGGQILSLLTPAQIRGITDSLDSRSQARQAGAGQMILGNRGGETLLAALNSAMEAYGRGDTNASINLPRQVKWWRSPFQNPTHASNSFAPQVYLAPSDYALNETMLSGLIADSLGRGMDYGRQITPIIKNSIERYHAVPPETNSYRGNTSEYGYANAEPLAPAARGGGMSMLRRLAALRDGMPFSEKQRSDRAWAHVPALDHPIFGELLLNRGNDAPANIGSDISMPEPIVPDTPPVESQAPPVEPSDGDLGFFFNRTPAMSPQILTGLLA